MPLYRQTYVQTSGEEKIIDVEASRPCAARDAAANYFNAWLAGEGRSSEGWRLLSQELVPDLADATWPAVQSPTELTLIGVADEDHIDKSEPEDEPFSI